MCPSSSVLALSRTSETVIHGGGGRPLQAAPAFFLLLMLYHTSPAPPARVSRKKKPPHNNPKPSGSCSMFFTRILSEAMTDIRALPRAVNYIPDGLFRFIGKACRWFSKLRIR